ncbi:MAG: DNA repair protein [Actinomycetota bacterium]|nr:DNA repair protein [Actinomycetota bacterium]
MATTRPERLHYTGDDAADELIARDPLALLIGFELDQQVPLQRAFAAPLELKRRLGGTLDVATLAGMDAGELEEIFAHKPALHRYPGVMARRTQDLCAAIESDYGGDPERIWGEAETGEELRRRLLDLPGIGEMKVRSLVAILVKRFGVRPPGWEGVLPTHPTLGDVDSPEALERYQEAKRAHKAKRRAEAR